MFYRIVLQGCAPGDHDPDTVKREFIRVTGVPQNVTERLFAGTPQPLKERVAKADAERIAATLRAIGASVTVEHDRLASQVKVEGGVQELLPPEHRGPPTIAPGSAPAAAPAPPSTLLRLRRRLRTHLPVLVGAPLAVAALVVVVPLADEAIRGLSPAEATPPVPVKALQTVATGPQAAPRASVLHGPWRCTDQRTGLSAFWTFGADGALTYHGDTYKEAAVVDPGVATGWQLVDGQIVFTFAHKSPATYATTDVNFSRLRYGDGEEVDVQCRRP